MNRSMDVFAAFFKDEAIPFAVFNPISGQAFGEWTQTFSGPNWTIRAVTISIPTDDIMEFLADDHMKHAEAPSDVEMEDMFATVGSESEEYRTAN
jgi:hypothetical protein